MERDKTMKEGLEQPNELPVIEDFVYDAKYRHFPQVVKYKGEYYDTRDMNGDNCIYRMTAEHRLELPGPSYIEVDKKGQVIKEY